MTFETAQKVTVLCEATLGPPFNSICIQKIPDFVQKNKNKNLGVPKKICKNSNFSGKKIKIKIGGTKKSEKIQDLLKKKWKRKTRIRKRGVGLGKKNIW